MLLPRLKIQNIINGVHTAPMHENFMNISAKIPSIPDSTQRPEGNESVSESILKNGKKGRRLLHLTVMKEEPI